MNDIPRDDGNTQEGAQATKDHSHDTLWRKAGRQRARRLRGAGQVEEVEGISGGVANGGDVLGFAGVEMVGRDGEGGL